MGRYSLQQRLPSEIWTVNSTFPPSHLQYTKGEVCRLSDCGIDVRAAPSLLAYLFNRFFMVSMLGTIKKIFRLGALVFLSVLVSLRW